MTSDVCTKKPKKAYKIWETSHMKVNIKTYFRVICHTQIGPDGISDERLFSNVSYVAQLSSSCFL